MWSSTAQQTGGFWRANRFASQLNSVEAAKAGIEIWVYDQGAPVRGTEYFLGRAAFRAVHLYRH